MTNKAMIIGSAVHAILATGDKDFLRDGGGGRRLTVAPELGAPYGGGGTDSGKTTTDPYEGFAEYARGDADLDRRMRDLVHAEMAGPNGDEILDRVCIEKNSPFYEHNVDQLGVRIDGIEQDSVIEYCISGKWARIGERDHRGHLIWEFDHYRTRRVEGVKIEPYWRRALSRQQRRARAAKLRKVR